MQATESQYCLTIAGMPTGCIGSQAEVDRHILWNSVHNGNESYGSLPVAPGDVEGWGDLFRCPTDRGDQQMSIPYLTAPTGTLVDAIFAAMVKDDFRLDLYPKEPWYAIKQLMKEAGPSHHLLICNYGCTYLSPRLDYSQDYDKILYSQDLIDTHSALEQAIYQVEREHWPHRYLIAVDKHDPFDGTLVRLEYDVAIAVLKLSQASLKKKPVITRSQDNLVIAPGHLPYYYDIQQQAAELGVADAFEIMIQRCINYADTKVYYQCLLSPAPMLGKWAFYWSPQTKAYGGGPWRSMIDGGVVFDENERIWRFSS